MHRRLRGISSYRWQRHTMCTQQLVLSASQTLLRTDLSESKLGCVRETGLLGATHAGCGRCWHGSSGACMRQVIYVQKPTCPCASKLNLRTYSCAAPDKSTMNPSAPPSSGVNTHVACEACGGPGLGGRPRKARSSLHP
jgi:hypothetical protein